MENQTCLKERCCPDCKGPGCDLSCHYGFPLGEGAVNKAAEDESDSPPFPAYSLARECQRLRDLLAAERAAREAQEKSAADSAERCADVMQNSAQMLMLFSHVYRMRARGPFFAKVYIAQLEALSRNILNRASGGGSWTQCPRCGNSTACKITKVDCGHPYMRCAACYNQWEAVPPSGHE